MDVADHRSLRSGFLASAAAHPGRIAIDFDGADGLSYGDMDRMARLWAAALVERCGGRPSRVGVLGARTRATYVGTLAALYAGAAFVPLNPRFPRSRTRTMLERARVQALIVEPDSAGLLGGLLSGLADPPQILLPENEPGEAPPGPVLTRDDLAGLAPLESLPAVLGDDLAYLMFTSGTTGVPKGVGITHANVGHFLEVMSEHYGFGPEERFSQTFDPTFDLSIFDCFMAYRAGATLCAMSRKDLLAPARYVRNRGISVWFSVPSVPAMMRKMRRLDPGSMPGLRWSLFCGEPLPRRSAEAWAAAAPASTLENLYGPTELTIACFLYRWDPGRSPGECVNDVVPIGRPYPGLASRVEAEPGGEGDPLRGELWVCGPQTVPGYWGSPEATAEKFVSCEVAPGVVKRFYRTGDRVQRRADGLYAHLGRIDDQVKVSGYRVELGEIEAILLAQPGVASTAAIPWPVEDGSASGIVAFVVGNELEVEALLAACRAALPSYMVPKALRLVDALPLNANGKTDRGELARRLEAEAS